MSCKNMMLPGYTIVNGLCKLQGVGDIDRDIEAASLKSLAARSRLNSALTSVYAKALLQQEGATEDGIALEQPAAVDPETQRDSMMTPESASAQKGAIPARLASAARTAEASAPAQQLSASQVRPAIQRRTIGHKEAEAIATEPASQGAVLVSEPFEQAIFQNAVLRNLAVTFFVTMREGDLIADMLRLA